MSENPFKWVGLLPKLLPLLILTRTSRDMKHPLAILERNISFRQSLELASRWAWGFRPMPALETIGPPRGAVEMGGQG